MSKFFIHKENSILQGIKKNICFHFFIIPIAKPYFLATATQELTIFHNNPNALKMARVLAILSATGSTIFQENEHIY